MLFSDKVTSAGLTAAPFNSSDVNTVAVEPPSVPLIAVKVSPTARIIGAVTVTVSVTVLQFVGFVFSQIV